MIFSGSLIRTRMLLTLAAALSFCLLPAGGRDQFDKGQIWQQFLKWCEQATPFKREDTVGFSDWGGEKAQVARFLAR